MNKKILVIDDEESIQEVLKIILECEGYSIQILDSSERLSDVLLQGLPDVILLDFSLPGETGDVIAKKLRAGANTSTIPIIMLSAHHTAAKIAFNCGVDAFIPKPFSVGQLLQTIRRHTNMPFS